MDEACQQCAEQIDAGDFDVLFANSCRFFGVPSIASLRATADGLVPPRAIRVAL
jgi:hypothetical protein